MSPSEPEPPSEQPPPEVLAIAVALAFLSQAEERPIGPSQPGPWRLGGRRWTRRVHHRWS